MDQQELKDRLRALIRQREDLEREATQISDRLTAPGMPGLTGGLIDKEASPTCAAPVICYHTETPPSMPWRCTMHGGATT